jgi:hypothetical protein
MAASTPWQSTAEGCFRLARARLGAQGTLAKLTHPTDQCNGSVKENVEPFPSSLSTQILPP